MLFRNTDGSIKKAGRIRHVLEADFITGVRPAWLSLVGGAGGETFTAPSTGRPAINITSATADNADAGLSGPAFDLTKLEMLEVSVHGISITATGGGIADVSLGAWSTDLNHGARLYQDGSTASQVSASTFPAPATDLFDYNWRGGVQVSKWHDLAIRIYPRSQMLYVLTGNRAVDYGQHRPEMGVTGVVIPQMFARNKWDDANPDVPTTVSIEKFVITAEYR